MILHSPRKQFQYAATFPLFPDSAFTGRLTDARALWPHGNTLSFSPARAAHLE